MIPGLLLIFLHGCEIKSGSGLGTRLCHAACILICSCIYLYAILVSRLRPKIGRGLGTRLCTQYALRSGELWSACDIVFCMHLGWEDVIVHEQYLQNNKISFSNKIQSPLWKLSKNLLWNPEICFEISFEIQKSTLKSRNPEINMKYRNPIWNPKSTWNPVDFEISYTAWDTPWRTPFLAICNMLRTVLLFLYQHTNYVLLTVLIV